MKVSEPAASPNGPLASEHSEIPFGTPRQSTGALYGIHEADAEMLKRDNSWIKQVMSDFEPAPEPDFYVKHGDVIALGDITIRVIETPGHTQGGVCYYIDNSTV